MIAGLLLALVSAALINIGFLLQHRALRDLPTADGSRARGSPVGGSPVGGPPTGAARLRRALRNPVWLAGQGLGWIGFCAQIVAVALAPLSLVQAFAAGGLALSVPIAAGIFHISIGRAQTVCVAAIAAGLAALPLGLAGSHERLSSAALWSAVAVCSLVGLMLAARRRPWARAAAAGAFYGVADAAIKAVSVHLAHHGAAAALSPWTAVAAVGTFAGFVCFQSALAADPRAVTSISLMNALAAVVALGCGLGAFSESLGATEAVRLGHLAAISVVLACVPVLAGAQAQLTEQGAGADVGWPAQPGHQRRGKAEADGLHGRAEAGRA
ncbi:MAG TPA: hypothetical protein VKV27_05445 [Solirubrobacteraceae bacterium]|nr:hypothetical protein [Solirubrobacteraceae bacterium]